MNGLFLHGSSTAVARVLSESRKEGRGPRWLAERMRQAFWWFGLSRGRFYTHIHDGEIVAYLMEHEQEFKGQEKSRHFFMQSSRSTRKMCVAAVRRVASRYGTPDDEVVRNSDGLRISRLAFDYLLQREDATAVDYFVAEAVSLDERRSWAARDLAQLPRDAVAHARSVSG